MEKAEAATLGDVMEALERLGSRLDLFQTKMETDLAAGAESILSNVFRLAEALQSRVTDLERSDANMKHRLAMLEERLTELEKKLNLPPTRVEETLRMRARSRPSGGGRAEGPRLPATQTVHRQKPAESARHGPRHGTPCGGT